MTFEMRRPLRKPCNVLRHGAYRRFSLQRTAGPYSWVIFDQVIEHSLRADVRFAPKATKLARRCNMSRRATSGLMHRSKLKLYSITSSARACARAHSGNPAFRRPSIISVEFDCPPRAIHPDIVKVGSTSSRRAAASRASAFRPRWAKADARTR